MIRAALTFSGRYQHCRDGVREIPSRIHISRAFLLECAEALRSAGEFDQDGAQAEALERLADGLAGLSKWQRLALKLAGVHIDTGGAIEADGIDGQ